MNSGLLEKFKERHVMIIGDVMLDRYLYGQVSRISPEAPVPVLDYDRTDHRLGGAANVALNIQAMGGRVTLVGMTGKDEEANSFRQLLRDSSISDRWIIGLEERMTTLKTRVMARGQHLLRVDREDRSCPSEAVEQRIISALEDAIREEAPEGLILQDYNKGLLTRRVIESAIGVALARNLPVFVDPKTRNIECYAGCTVFKPNLYEASQIIGSEITTDEMGLKKATERLQEIVDHEVTLLTLGEAGLYLKRKNQDGLYVPSIPQEIADVCGAGDSVISTLTMCYLSGGNDESIAKLSNIAGHIACRHPGVSPVSLKELNNELKP